MARPRKCPECGESLAGKLPTAMTCGKGSCRGRRARRIKRQQREAGKKRALPEALQPFAEENRVNDTAARVLEDELRPVVREAITDEVLRGVQTLVGLTPAAVARIQEDLDSPDHTIRQRAYTLQLRYTMGNPSVAPAPTEQQPGGLTVQFNMPRPADTPAPEVVVVDDGDRRMCAECNQMKREDDMVGNSDRCVECHERVQAEVRERFGA